MHSRRQFLKSTSGIGGSLVLPQVLTAKHIAKPDSETLVTTLYKSLNKEQRTKIVFPYANPLREKIDNNWNITKTTLTDSFSKDQQALVKEIFLGLHSEEYAEKVFEQVEDDGGFGDSSIAIFGNPGDKNKFEFVITGRHCTRRCDGNSSEGTGFGGPIFYGHAGDQFNEKPDHPNNAYWFQAKRANAAFNMLDGTQRKKALVPGIKRERGAKTIELSGKKEGLPGLRFADMTADQKNEARNVISDLLAPFREKDAKECLKLIDAQGIDNLHMAFYKDQDLGNDGVWDNWQIEGPSMIWYFRGKPHVHVWAHVKG